MRKIAIASIIYQESLITASEYLKIPKKVFDDVTSQISSLDGVNITLKNQRQGFFECNGLMRYIRRCVSKIQNKYKGLYRITVHNASASQKKRCIVEIRPLLSEMPNQVKAQYKDGLAYHKDGPFKGEEVLWSTRIDQDSISKENEVGSDIFLIKPDLYRSTFYGWK